MRPDRHAASTSSSDGTEIEARLREGAAEIGIELDAAAVAKLLDYLSLLRKWNGVYNLTAIRDPRQMLTQHLLDSLAILPPLRRRLQLAGATVADVGSGAGLPGLVLAIAEPALHIVSIEPVGKKAAFQRQVCAELALTNVEVLAVRAESVVRRCDLVVSRAFASLADFVDASAGLMGDAPLLAAMKGQRTGLDAELAALPGDCVVEVEPLRVPSLGADRHLVLIRRGAPAVASAARSR